MITRIKNTLGGPALPDTPGVPMIEIIDWCRVKPGITPPKIIIFCIGNIEM